MTTTYEHKTQLVGDDYHGLPIQPVTYGKKPSRTGIDWVKINADYVANGGHVDDTVWPEVGKVVVISGNANSSRANLHTFTEAQDDEYDESPTAAPKRVARRKPAAKSTATGRRLTNPERDRLCLRYRNGESIPELAKAYGLSTSSVRHTLKRRQEPIRSISDAAKLRWEAGR